MPHFDITKETRNRICPDLVPRSIYAALFIALFFVNQMSYADSVLNKCTDGKQITYTDKPCEKLGLKDGGAIKNTVTIVQATSITAPKKPETLQNKSHTNDESSAAVEGDIYQCTAYYDVVTFSSTPCPEFGYVRQLGFNQPVTQQLISRKSACEKISANPAAYSGNSLACP